MTTMRSGAERPARGETNVRAAVGNDSGAWWVRYVLCGTATGEESRESCRVWRSGAPAIDDLPRIWPRLVNLSTGGFGGGARRREIGRGR